MPCCTPALIASSLAGIGTSRSSVPEQVGQHLADLLARVAQGLERGLDARVGDLEVPAAGELLELDEREVRLDARRVAVHQQPDGARGRDDAHLGVAEAVLRAERVRLVPRLGRACRSSSGVGLTGTPRTRAGRGRSAPGGSVQVSYFSLSRSTPWAASRWLRMTRSIVLLVVLVAREGPVLTGEFGALAVAAPGQDRREAPRRSRAPRPSRTGRPPASASRRGSRSPGPACGTSSSARRSRLLGNAAISTLISSTIVHRSTACSYFSTSKTRRLRVVELHDVERRQVARRVVEEHVLAARVRSR
jgi:hypothetical protein